MPIGDVWRVDASGLGTGPGEGLEIVSFTWVNVWHLKVTAGIGTPTLEGNDAVAIVEAYYEAARAVALFGSGTVLKRIRAVRQSDQREQVTGFEKNLGDPGTRAVPNGSAVLVTGRSEALGRKTERYVSCVTINMLQHGGQLVAEGAVILFREWMASGTGVTFTMRPCLFDRDGVLPTLFVTRARISPGWRAQRRRSTGVVNELPTVYVPVS